MTCDATSAFPSTLSRTRRRVVQARVSWPSGETFHAGRQGGRLAGRQAGKLAGRQTGKQAGGQAGKQAGSPPETCGSGRPAPPQAMAGRLGPAAAYTATGEGKGTTLWIIWGRLKTIQLH